MKNNKEYNISYKQAEISDVTLLIDLYNAAFYDDYCRYGECPGYGKSKEEMERSMISYPKEIIYYGRLPIGVLSVKQIDKGIYSIGCLCVLPEYQGKGIGTSVFQHFESKLSDWKKITLVTPCDNERNIRFYTEKCGFSVEEKIKDGNVILCRFSKYNHVQFS